MRRLRSISVASLLFVFMFVTVAFTFSKDNVNVQSAVTQDAQMHKVIADSGLLTADGEGVTLWHDYGAFALYKVSDAALNQLSETTRSQVTLANDMDRILLDVHPFNTQTDSLDIPQALHATETRGATLHLVQFVGPIKDEWLKTIEGIGATPIHYVANNAYLVWADGSSRAQLNALATEKDFLQYSAPYQPYFKLGMTLIDRVTEMKDIDAVLPVTIQMYRHANSAATEAVIRDATIEQISDWSAILDYQNTIVTMRVSDIASIIHQPDVVWVGQRFERTLLDEVQGQIIANQVTGGAPTSPGYLAWLTGLGFSTNPADYPIVDVVDDGIGNGTVNSGDSTLHELGLLANPTRLSYVSNCTSAASGEGVDGHGHINASIVGGYDTRVGFPFEDPNGYQRGLGINPFARLAGTRIFDPFFDLSNCGGTDTGLIQSSQDDGALITSNSWGCAGCAFQYDDSSQAFDVGVRDADLTQAGNQEMIMLFAAGNSGPGAATVGTPGNGKNMITVGASENVRPSDEDGAWTDGCGIGSTGADDWRDVISFSSRGPSPGGRVKPEVIAPGTHIQGTASTNAGYTGNSVCDQFRPSGQTTFAASSGTSHSTPAVAGAASLYYYWLENNYSVTTPSPALMKSYMIAHPTYLTGVSANDTLPSNNQGYGMPNLEVAFDDAERFFLDQTVVLNNSGETWTWNGSVADPSRPVRIVMAYTDEAGNIGTSPQVNNVNLSAVVGGSTYLGNRFSGQWSITGGSADNANNYEAIFLPAGTTGNIDITVTGFNIAGDGIPNSGDATDQDFALVCYNCSETTGGGSTTGTLHYDWNCDGSYSSVGITFNNDGTFATGSSGKWVEIEDFILWQYNSSNTTYVGNTSGKTKAGIMSTFSGLEGCWYVVEDTSLLLNGLAPQEDSYDELGNGPDGTVIDIPAIEETNRTPTPMAPVTGSWTLYFDWNCDGSYTSVGLTINANGTFTTGSSGKWTQLEGMIEWKFDNTTTAYGGNVLGDAMVGSMSTFNGLDGCWYALKSGSMAAHALQSSDSHDATGEAVRNTGVTVQRPANSLTNIAGTWTVYYDWGCNGGYGSANLTFNNNGTFSSGSYTGNWNSLEGNAIWQYDTTNKTTYEGNVAGEAMVGLMSTFSGLEGCWYALQSGSLAPNAIDALDAGIDVNGHAEDTQAILDLQANQGDTLDLVLPGSWTLYFDWNCDGSYFSTTITYNNDGTFSTGSTGNWIQTEGMALWRYTSGTAYGGNGTGEAKVGIMSTFSTLEGCWYTIKN